MSKYLQVAMPDAEKDFKKSFVLYNLFYYNFVIIQKKCH